MARRVREAFAYGDHISKLTSIKRPHLAGLDLLRVISTVWIIVMHSYSFALAWLQFEPKTLTRPEASLLYQFVSNGTFAVDNFFLLSGFLAGRAPRSPAGPGLRLVWNRFVRLAPAMLLMILASVLVFSSLHDDSPNWPKSTLMFNQWCASHWAWLLNLFMVHNLFRTETMCYSHSWYLAADFQLFILLQLCRQLLRRASRRSANLCYALLLVLCQAGAAITVYLSDLPPVPQLPTRSAAAMNNFFGALYIKPHYWAASYFIGVLLAENFNELARLRTKRAPQLVCLNLFLLFALVFSNLFFFRSAMPMGREYASVYAFLARPIWSLNVACLLVICPRVKWAAALPKRPLACASRLSFAAYLLHPVLMAAFYGSRAESFHFSHHLLLYFTIGNICLTYLGAALLHILIELPCQRLLTIGLRVEREAVSAYELRTIATSARGSPDESAPARSKQKVIIDFRSKGGE